MSTNANSYLKIKVRQGSTCLDSRQHVTQHHTEMSALHSRLSTSDFPIWMKHMRQPNAYQNLRSVLIYGFRSLWMLRWHSLLTFSSSDTDASVSLSSSSVCFSDFLFSLLFSLAFFLFVFLWKWLFYPMDMDLARTDLLKRLFMCSEREVHQQCGSAVTCGRKEAVPRPQSRR